MYEFSSISIMCIAGIDAVVLLCMHGWAVGGDALDACSPMRLMN